MLCNPLCCSYSPLQRLSCLKVDFLTTLWSQRAQTREIISSIDKSAYHTGKLLRPRGPVEAAAAATAGGGRGRRGETGHGGVEPGDVLPVDAGDISAIGYVSKYYASPNPNSPMSPLASTFPLTRASIGVGFADGATAAASRGPGAGAGLSNGGGILNASDLNANSAMNLSGMSDYSNGNGQGQPYRDMAEDVQDQQQQRQRQQQQRQKSASQRASSPQELLSTKRIPPAFSFSGAATMRGSPTPTSQGAQGGRDGSPGGSIGRSRPAKATSSSSSSSPVRFHSPDRDREEYSQAISATVSSSAFHAISHPSCHPMLFSVKLASFNLPNSSLLILQDGVNDSRTENFFQSVHLSYPFKWLVSVLLLMLILMFLILIGCDACCRVDGHRRSFSARILATSA